MNYEDYVCGTKFRDCADVIIGQHGKIDFKEKKTIAHIGDTYHGAITVYCHTHDFRYVLDRIATIAENVVLITHNSDGAVKDSSLGQPIGENDADVQLCPKNVIKWYAQNVLSDPDDKKIVPIPIGLENSYCFPYDKARMLFDKNPNEWEPIPRHPIYFNCNLNTNPSERGKALECSNASKKVTVKMGMNGQDYDGFLNDIINHRAVICPKGNGLDCHRTWETLYLKRVPIMTSIPSIQSFGLPILFLRDWDQLWNYWQRHYSLEDAIEDCITDIYGNVGMQALSMNYWIRRIRNAE